MREASLHLLILPPTPPAVCSAPSSSAIERDRTGSSNTHAGRVFSTRSSVGGCFHPLSDRPSSAPKFCSWRSTPRSADV